MQTCIITKCTLSKHKLPRSSANQAKRLHATAAQAPTDFSETRSVYHTFCKIQKMLQQILQDTSKHRSQLRLRHGLHRPPCQQLPADTSVQCSKLPQPLPAVISNGHAETRAMQCSKLHHSLYQLSSAKTMLNTEPMQSKTCNALIQQHIKHCNKLPKQLQASQTQLPHETKCMPGLPRDHDIIMLHPRRSIEHADNK